MVTWHTLYQQQNTIKSSQSTKCFSEGIHHTKKWLTCRAGRHYTSEITKNKVHRQRFFTYRKHFPQDGQQQHQSDLYLCPWCFL